MKNCCNNFDCDAEKDAEIINQSLKGNPFLKNDNKNLIKVLGRRTNAHLQVVRQKYEEKYNKDLLKSIDSLHRKYKRLLIGLLKSHDEYRSEKIYSALNGIYIDNHTLIDFIIGNDTKSINDMKDYFRQKYHISLEEMLEMDTKGNFEKLLIRSLNANRSLGIEEDKVESDISKLHESCETKERSSFAEVFTEILTERSPQHLSLVNTLYKQLYNKDLEEEIQKQTTSGWFQTSLLACLETPASYWAQRVRMALKSLFTDKNLLIHCFSQCNKLFLQDISQIKKYQF